MLQGAISVHRREPTSWKPEEIDLITAASMRSWETLYATVLAAEKGLKKVADSTTPYVCRVSVFWYCDLPFDRLQWIGRSNAFLGLLLKRSDPTLDDFYSHIHPEDRDVVAAAINESIDNCKPYDVIMRTISGEADEVKYPSHGWRGIRRKRPSDSLRRRVFGCIAADESRIGAPRSGSAQE
ncbi:MAG: hypothetical protein U0892_19165 [Pirellulales bacterium]